VRPGDFIINLMKYSYCLLACFEQVAAETLSEWIKIPEKMIMAKEATLSALRSEPANCVLADTPLKKWNKAEVVLFMVQVDASR
jgi:hypothetical protein